MRQARIVVRTSLGEMKDWAFEYQYQYQDLGVVICCFVSAMKLDALMKLTLKKACENLAALCLVHMAGLHLLSSVVHTR